MEAHGAGGGDEGLGVRFSCLDPALSVFDFIHRQRVVLRPVEEVVAASGSSRLQDGTENSDDAAAGGRARGAGAASASAGDDGNEPEPESDGVEEDDMVFLEDEFGRVLQRNIAPADLIRGR